MIIKYSSAGKNENYYKNLDSKLHNIKDEFLTIMYIIMI